MTDSSVHLAGDGGIIGTENYSHFNSSGSGLGLGLGSGLGSGAGAGSGSHSPTNITTTPHTTSNHGLDRVHNIHAAPPSPTPLLRPRSAFQMMSSSQPTDESFPSSSSPSFPSSSSSSSFSSTTKLLSQTRSSPAMVGPSGQPMTAASALATGGGGTASPARAKSPLAGYGSSSGGGGGDSSNGDGGGLSGSGIGGIASAQSYPDSTALHPQTSHGTATHPASSGSSNRVKGLIRRLGVGGSSRHTHAPKESSFMNGNDPATDRDGVSINPTLPCPALSYTIMSYANPILL